MFKNRVYNNSQMSDLSQTDHNHSQIHHSQQTSQQQISAVTSGSNGSTTNLNDNMNELIKKRFNNIGSDSISASENKNAVTSMRSSASRLSNGSRRSSERGSVVINEDLETDKPRSSRRKSGSKVTLSQIKEDKSLSNASMGSNSISLNSNGNKTRFNSNVDHHSHVTNKTGSQSGKSNIKSGPNRLSKSETKSMTSRNSVSGIESNHHTMSSVKNAADGLRNSIISKISESNHNIGGPNHSNSNTSTINHSMSSKVGNGSNVIEHHHSHSHNINHSHNLGDKDVFGNRNSNTSVVSTRISIGSNNSNKPKISDRKSESSIVSMRKSDRSKNSEIPSSKNMFKSINDSSSSKRRSKSQRSSDIKPRSSLKRNSGNLGSRNNATIMHEHHHESNHDINLGNNVHSTTANTKSNFSHNNNAFGLKTWAQIQTGNNQSKMPSTSYHGYNPLYGFQGLQLKQDAEFKKFQKKVAKSQKIPPVTKSMNSAALNTVESEFESDATTISEAIRRLKQVKEEKKKLSERNSLNSKRLSQMELHHVTENEKVHHSSDFKTNNDHTLDTVKSKLKHNELEVNNGDHQHSSDHHESEDSNTEELENGGKRHNYHHHEHHEYHDTYQNKEGNANVSSKKDSFTKIDKQIDRSSMIEYGDNQITKTNEEKIREESATESKEVIKSNEINRKGKRTSITSIVSEVVTAETKETTKKVSETLVKDSDDVASASFPSESIRHSAAESTTLGSTSKRDSLSNIISGGRDGPQGSNNINGNGSDSRNSHNIRSSISIRSSNSGTGSKNSISKSGSMGSKSSKTSKSSNNIRSSNSTGSKGLRSSVRSSRESSSNIGRTQSHNQIQSRNHSNPSKSKSIAASINSSNPKRIVVPAKKENETWEERKLRKTLKKADKQQRLAERAARRQARAIATHAPTILNDDTKHRRRLSRGEKRLSLVQFTNAQKAAKRKDLEKYLIQKLKNPEAQEKMQQKLDVLRAKRRAGYANGLRGEELYKASTMNDVRTVVTRKNSSSNGGKSKSYINLNYVQPAPSTCGVLNHENFYSPRTRLSDGCKTPEMRNSKDSMTPADYYTNLNDASIIDHHDRRASRISDVSNISRLSQLSGVTTIWDDVKKTVNVDENKTVTRDVTEKVERDSNVEINSDGGETKTVNTKTTERIVDEEEIETVTTTTTKRCPNGDIITTTTTVPVAKVISPKNGSDGIQPKLTHEGMKEIYGSAMGKPNFEIKTPEINYGLHEYHGFGLKGDNAFMTPPPENYNGVTGSLEFLNSTNDDGTQKKVPGRFSNKDMETPRSNRNITDGMMEYSELAQSSEQLPMMPFPKMQDGKNYHYHMTEETHTTITRRKKHGQDDSYHYVNTNSNLTNNSAMNLMSANTITSDHRRNKVDSRQDYLSNKAYLEHDAEMRRARLEQYEKDKKNRDREARRLKKEYEREARERQKQRENARKERERLEQEAYELNRIETIRREEERLEIERIQRIQIEEDRQRRIRKEKESKELAKIEEMNKRLRAQERAARAEQEFYNKQQADELEKRKILEERRLVLEEKRAKEEAIAAKLRQEERLRQEKERIRIEKEEKIRIETEKIRIIEERKRRMEDERRQKEQAIELSRWRTEQANRLAEIASKKDLVDKPGNGRLSFLGQRGGMTYAEACRLEMEKNLINKAATEFARADVEHPYDAQKRLDRFGTVVVPRDGPLSNPESKNDENHHHHHHHSKNVHIVNRHYEHIINDESDSDFPKRRHSSSTTHERRRVSRNRDYMHPHEFEIEQSNLRKGERGVMVERLEGACGAGEFDSCAEETTTVGPRRRNSHTGITNIKTENHSKYVTTTTKKRGLNEKVKKPLPTFHRPYDIHQAFHEFNKSVATGEIEQNFKGDQFLDRRNGHNSIVVKNNRTNMGSGLNSNPNFQNLVKRKTANRTNVLEKSNAAFNRRPERNHNDINSGYTTVITPNTKRNTEQNSTTTRRSFTAINGTPIHDHTTVTTRRRSTGSDGQVTHEENNRKSRNNLLAIETSDLSSPGQKQIPDGDEHVSDMQYLESKSLSPKTNNSAFATSPQQSLVTSRIQSHSKSGVNSSPTSLQYSQTGPVNSSSPHSYLKSQRSATVISPQYTPARMFSSNGLSGLNLTSKNKIDTYLPDPTTVNDIFGRAHIAGSTKSIITGQDNNTCSSASKVTAGIESTASANDHASRNGLPKTHYISPMSQNSLLKPISEEREVTSSIRNSAANCMPPGSESDSEESFDVDGRTTVIENVNEYDNEITHTLSMLNLYNHDDGSHCQEINEITSIDSELMFAELRLPSPVFTRCRCSRESVEFQTRDSAVQVGAPEFHRSRDSYISHGYEGMDLTQLNLESDDMASDIKTSVTTVSLRLDSEIDDDNCTVTVEDIFYRDSAAETFPMEFDELETEGPEQIDSSSNRNTNYQYGGEIIFGADTSHGSEHFQPSHMPTGTTLVTNSNTMTLSGQTDVTMNLNTNSNLNNVSVSQCQSQSEATTVMNLNTMSNNDFHQGESGQQVNFANDITNLSASASASFVNSLESDNARSSAANSKLRSNDYGVHSSGGGNIISDETASTKNHSRVKEVTTYYTSNINQGNSGNMNTNGNSSKIIMGTNLNSNSKSTQQVLSAPMTDFNGKTNLNTQSLLYANMDTQLNAPAVSNMNMNNQLGASDLRTQQTTSFPGTINTTRSNITSNQTNGNTHSLRPDESRLSKRSGKSMNLNTQSMLYANLDTEFDAPAVSHMNMNNQLGTSDLRTQQSNMQTGQTSSRKSYPTASNLNTNQNSTWGTSQFMNLNTGNGSNTTSKFMDLNTNGTSAMNLNTNGTNMMTSTNLNSNTFYNGQIDLNSEAFRNLPSDEQRRIKYTEAAGFLPHRPGGNPLADIHMNSEGYVHPDAKIYDSGRPKVSKHGRYSFGNSSIMREELPYHYVNSTKSGGPNIPNNNSSEFHMNNMSTNYTSNVHSGKYNNGNATQKHLSFLFGPNGQNNSHASTNLTMNTNYHGNDINSQNPSFISTNTVRDNNTYNSTKSKRTSRISITAIDENGNKVAPDPNIVRKILETQTHLQKGNNNRNSGPGSNFTDSDSESFFDDDFSDSRSNSDDPNYNTMNFPTGLNTNDYDSHALGISSFKLRESKAPWNRLRESQAPWNRAAQDSSTDNGSELPGLASFAFRSSKAPWKMNKDKESDSSDTTGDDSESDSDGSDDDEEGTVLKHEIVEEVVVEEESTSKHDNDDDEFNFDEEKKLRSGNSKVGFNSENNSFRSPSISTQLRLESENDDNIDSDDNHHQHRHRSHRRVSTRTTTVMDSNDDDQKLKLARASEADLHRRRQQAFQQAQQQKLAQQQKAQQQKQQRALALQKLQQQKLRQDKQRKLLEKKAMQQRHQKREELRAFRNEQARLRSACTKFWMLFFGIWVVSLLAVLGFIYWRNPGFLGWAASNANTNADALKLKGKDSAEINNEEDKDVNVARTNKDNESESKTKKTKKVPKKSSKGKKRGQKSNTESESDDNVVSEPSVSEQNQKRSKKKSRNSKKAKKDDPSSFMQTNGRPIKLVR